MDYESIAHEGERNNCFSIKSNQLVKKISRQNIFRQLKLDLKFALSRRFSLLVGYNKQLTSSSTNQNAALIIDHQLDFTNKIYSLRSNVFWSVTELVMNCQEKSSMATNLTQLKYDRSQNNWLVFVGFLNLQPSSFFRSAGIT